VTETVHSRDGDAFTLHPCPPWCTETQHFGEDELIYADDGYHHYGPETAVPTSDRVLLSDPETVVKVILKSWTPRLDADPGPARVELQLATTDENTDMYVELTPSEARAVASALFKTADIAEPSARQRPGDGP
jgi:hypothetical protein